tara:strand:- start:14501 stop:14935 length:435 start_codon:yes stop_codon:yes gene_type:complete
MPLYLTDRISEFDIEQNDSAYFVYFDSIRRDNNNVATLRLRDKHNGVPIVYRHNMSENGNWSLDKFKLGQGDVEPSIEFNNCLAKFSSLILENKLVVFPMHSFNVILHGMYSDVSNIYRKEIEKIISKSLAKKDFVSHALSFKI